MDDLIQDFIAETREGLEALDSELVRFEQNPGDPELLGGIFRLIHTIKGASGFLSLGRLQSVAHAAENVLGAFRDGELDVTSQAVSAILDTVDLIRSLIDALGEGGAEPAGDDSALIARLTALMNDGGRPAVAAGASASSDRPLIERLGGDAAIDAASEMAIQGLRAGPLGSLFGAIDPDYLHGALRDGLIATARGSAPSQALVARLAALDLAAATPEALAALRQEVGAALVALEAELGAPEALFAGLGGPASAPKPAPLPVPAAEPEGPTGPQSIRVSVDALEHLMTVASELVLIRNQLIQTLRLDPESPFAAPLHRLNQVTTELQEGVMTARMQPIGGAWAKLPRLVRDLAHELGKRIDLQMVGQETELDRQVLELIKDPLTHMIRNAADHGIETPDERVAAGKPATGRITLAARHEGGAIVIELADDGRGLSASKLRAKAVSSGLTTAAQAEAMSDADVRQFIFAPGFSTAGEVTSVSGRGVGMDVVRNNIEKIGGAIELASTEGEGSRFTIRIPLTLTIVSALIVECCGERFALPQSAIVELVSANETSSHRIEHVDQAAVLRLRDRLLPLVSLQSLLKLDPERATPGETCIVVAQVGAFSFGVIVDRVFDTEEIVVKPVASVLRHLKLYSGATILGDGAVTLILDLKGISIETGAAHAAALSVAAQAQPDAEDREVERTAILVFRAVDDALKAAPLSTVSRIEEIDAEALERVDGRTVMQYRGRLMPVVGSDGAEAGRWEGGARRPLLVFARDDQALGLLVKEVVDIVEGATAPELSAATPGAAGSLVINGAATELIDIDHYWRLASGRPAEVEAAAPAARADAKRVLLIDGSPFSQVLLRPLLAKSGYDVSVATGPEAALALYQAGERFHLIMADISDRAEPARRLATALAQATGWHATPLLGLDSHRVGELAAMRVADAAGEGFDELKGAA